MPHTTYPLSVSVSEGQEGLWRIYADKAHKGSMSAWITKTLREASHDRPPSPDVIFSTILTPHRTTIYLKLAKELLDKLTSLATVWGCQGKAHALRAMLQPEAETVGWMADPLSDLIHDKRLSFPRETTIPALWLSPKFTNAPLRYFREHAITAYLHGMARIEAGADRTQSDESIGCDDFLRLRLRQMRHTFMASQKALAIDPATERLSFELTVPCGQLVAAIIRVQPKMTEAKLYLGAASYVSWCNLKEQDADEWKSKFYKSHKSTFAELGDDAPRF